MSRPLTLQDEQHLDGIAEDRKAWRERTLDEDHPDLPPGAFPPGRRVPPSPLRAEATVLIVEKVVWERGDSYDIQAGVAALAAAGLNPNRDALERAAAAMQRRDELLDDYVDASYGAGRPLVEEAQDDLDEAVATLTLYGADVSGMFWAGAS